MAKRKKPSKDKISSFLKEVEKPFRYSYDEITSSDETEEIRRAKKALAALTKEFDLNTQIVRETLSGTLLHFAAYFKRKYFMKVLIDKGININAINDKGQTALHIVVLSKFQKIPSLHCVSLLIENGADVNVKDNEDQTPLDICALPRGNKRPAPRAVIDLLIENGATYGNVNKFIFNIANQTFSSNAYISLLKSVDASNINEVDSNGRTILHHAASLGEKIQFFLDKKVDVNIVDEYGRTPLHYALIRGEINNISLLYAKSNPEFKSLSFRDTFGNNILHFIFAFILPHCKSYSLTDTLKLMSKYLEIFEDNKILELALEVNNQNQTPFQFIISTITSKSLPPDFVYTGKKSRLEVLLDQLNYSDKFLSGCIKFFVEVFLSLYKLTDNIDLSHKIETEILKTVYRVYPKTLAQLMTPHPDLLSSDTQENYEYRAHKILNLKIPFSNRDSFVTNAIIYQTCLLKNVSVTIKGGIKSEIFYGPQIVYQLLQGCLPNNNFLPYDLSGIIALFLDSFTLNIVLPQVRRACAEVSHSIINCQNKISLPTASGREELTGEDANNYLWNMVCHTFLLRPENPDNSDNEIEQFANQIYEKIGTYLECRGINPSFGYSEIKKFFEMKLSEVDNPLFYHLCLFSLLKKIFSHEELFLKIYEKIHDEFKATKLFDSMMIKSKEKFSSYPCYQASEPVAENIPSNGLLEQDLFNLTYSVSQLPTEEISLENNEAIMNWVDDVLSINEDENKDKPHQNWFNSPIHTTRNLFSSQDYNEEQEQSIQHDDVSVASEEEIVFNSDGPTLKRLKLEETDDSMPNYVGKYSSF